MSLPLPIGEPVSLIYCHTATDRNLYFKHQVEDYGQRCWNAALEHAALICDGLQKWPSTEPRHCAEDIRSDKK
jgi:hypothetical protein